MDTASPTKRERMNGWARDGQKKNRQRQRYQKRSDGMKWTIHRENKRDKEREGEIKKKDWCRKSKRIWESEIMRKFETDNRERHREKRQKLLRAKREREREREREKERERERLSEEKRLIEEAKKSGKQRERSWLKRIGKKISKKCRR